MLDALLPFNMLGAGVYVLVGMTALLALAGAIRWQQLPWHRLAWAAIAVLFVSLALNRALQLEEGLQHALRTTAWMQERYEQRRAIQGPIVAGLLIAAMLVGSYLTMRLLPGLRGRRNIATLTALAASGALVVLVLVRIVSLHSVDALLYGPLKLNWLIDMGASAVVLLCGLVYLAVTRPAR